MVTPAYVRTLYAYDGWAGERLLSAVERLDEAALDAEPLAGLGSIRAILTHTIWALWIWRMRMEGQTPTSLPDPQEFAASGALRQRLVAEQAALRNHVDRLDDATLAANLVYNTTTGKRWATPLWQVLVHLANHGTQHRSEAAALLTALGQSPGDLDMIFFFRELAA